VFNLFKKKEKKDPVCGMVANENFIVKYAEMFCSENCLKAFESNKKNKKVEAFHSHDKDCGCCA